MVSDLELHIDLTMPSYNLDVNWIQTNSLTLIVLGGEGGGKNTTALQKLNYSRMHLDTTLKYLCKL